MRCRKYGFPFTIINHLKKMNKSFNMKKLSAILQVIAGR